MNATLAIRADGGEGIGAGHVMRCLALADAWQAGGGDVRWVASRLSPMLERAIAARHIPVSRVADAADTVAAVCTPGHTPAWVVVDGYGLQSEAQALRRDGLRLAVIDDDGRWGRYDCDVLINQNLGAERVEYDTAAETRLLGAAFAMIRREFLTQPVAAQPAPAVRRVLVSFGGDDRHRQGERVARVLQRVAPDVERVVTGGVLAAPAAMDGAARVITGTDMAAVIAASDAAVVAAGSICWELAYLGVPAITLTMADNQEAIARELAAAGVARALGPYDAVSDEAIASAFAALVANAGMRATMSARGRALIDGQGARRVADALAAHARRGALA